MLKMLTFNRVDAVAYAEDVAHFQFKKLGIKEHTLTPIYVLDDKAFTNFVFHRNTPLCVVKLFSDTVEKLHQKGVVQQIWDRYLIK